MTKNPILRTWEISGYDLFGYAISVYNIYVYWSSINKHFGSGQLVDTLKSRSVPSIMPRLYEIETMRLGELCSLYDQHHVEAGYREASSALLWTYGEYICRHVLKSRLMSCCHLWATPPPRVSRRQEPTPEPDPTPEVEPTPGPSEGEEIEGEEIAEEDPQ